MFYHHEDIVRLLPPSCQQENKCSSAAPRLPVGRLTSGRQWKGRCRRRWVLARISGGHAAMQAAAGRDGRGGSCTHGLRSL